MKVAILAGGYGSRISEESHLRPKPMIEIGYRPIIWHIMKIYSHYGFNDFVVLLGYKSYVIKEYFANYWLHQSDVVVETASSRIEIRNNKSEDWRVTLLDTGLETMTGGRISRARECLGDGTFMLTYGDGVSDVDITRVLEFHKRHGKAVTMTAVQPEGRFGRLQIAEHGRVPDFLEKPLGDDAWINGGFFICEPAVFDAIKAGDATTFEREPLECLAEAGELMAWKHDGFWMCMDTMRDKERLTELWENDDAPWKVWK